MSSCRPRTRRTRPARIVAALLAGALIALGLVLPVLAAVGPTKLENPAVSPTTATTATLVAFQVTYRNVKGTAPVYVRVRVGSSTTYPMTGTGTDWKGGVVFTVSTRLPAGVQAVTFEALDTEKFPDSLAFGTVDISAAPAPPPTPEPTPTAPATPSPTTAPAPTTAPTPTTAPGPAATAAPSASTTDAPSASAPPAGGGSTDTTGGSSGSSGGGTGAMLPGGDWNTSGAHDAWATETGASAFPSTGSGGSGTPDAASLVGGGRAWVGDRWIGAVAEVVSVPTVGGVTVDAPRSGAGTTPDLVGTDGVADGSTIGTAGGTGIAAALAATRTTFDAIFTTDGSYRSSGPWLAGPLSAGFPSVGWDVHRPGALIGFVGSSTAVAVWMAFALFGKRRRDEEPPAPPAMLAASAAQVVTAMVAPMAEPIDPESLMPRWRRPSLLEARRTDPLRAPAVTRPHLAFSAPPPGSDRERRLIRYAVAPLLDQPDELHGARLGDLSTGDEVELVERSGAYWLVACPDGRQGWLHRMTLGDIVSTARSMFDSADEEIDGQDVLAALLAARGIS